MSRRKKNIGCTDQCQIAMGRIDRLDDPEYIRLATIRAKEIEAFTTPEQLSVLMFEVVASCINKLKSSSVPTTIINSWDINLHCHAALITENSVTGKFRVNSDSYDFYFDIDRNTLVTLSEYQEIDPEDEDAAAEAEAEAEAEA